MKKLAAILFVLMCASGAIRSQDDSTQFIESSEYTEEYEQEETSTEGVNHTPVTPEELSSKTGSNNEDVGVSKFEHEQWRRVVNGESYSESVEKKKPTRGDKTSDDEEGVRSRRRSGAGDDEDEEYEGGSSAPIQISAIVKYFFYALVLGVVGYILFLVIKNTKIKPSGKKVTRPHVADAMADVEDIKELEIDRLLRDALATGNYRLAIRIYFLGLLQKLDDDGLIRWKKDKTNRDYLAELFSNEYFNDVRRLTIGYELVWYGDHNLSIPSYEQLISDFKAVEQKLKASKSIEKE